MKQKLILGGLMLALVVGMFLTETCKPKPKVPQIGLLMDAFTTPRWAKDTTAFIATVKKLGGAVICMSASGNAETQLKQARELIKQKVDVLVIVPVEQTAAAQIVKEASEAKITLISYDRLILNSDLHYYLSFDNIKIGELQASYVVRRLEKGNVALVGGPSSDQNSYYLRLGQIEILQPYIEKGTIKLVCNKQAATWSDTAGYRIAKECLANFKIDAFIAANDQLAKGVIRALEEKNLDGKVLVTGQDGDSIAIENIISGKQSMTVYKPVEALATATAELAMSIATNRPLDNLMLTTYNGHHLVPTVLLAPMVVNKGNIGMQINTSQYMDKKSYKQ